MGEPFNIGNNLVSTVTFMRPGRSPIAWWQCPGRPELIASLKVPFLAEVKSLLHLSPNRTQIPGKCPITCPLQSTGKCPFSGGRELRCLRCSVSARGSELLGGRGAIPASEFMLPCDLSLSSCSGQGAGGGRPLLLPHGSGALRTLHRERRPSGFAGQQPQVRDVSAHAGFPGFSSAGVTAESAGLGQETLGSCHIASPGGPGLALSSCELWRPGCIVSCGHWVALWLHKQESVKKK